MKTLFSLVTLMFLPMRLLSGGRRGRAKAATPWSWPRRIMLAGGSLALVGGLVLLGIGAYQVTHQQPEHRPGAGVAVLNFTDVAGTIYDRPVQATPSPTPAPTPVPAPPPPLRDSPYRIIVPKVGIDAAVVTYGLDANNVPEVPYNGWDVAWYNFSAKPGTGGNAVFAGHVTWNGHAVFYSLDQLAAGDDILLVGTDGTKVSYKVSEVFLVDENDSNALSVMGPSGSDTMTVITCGGDPYFVGGIAGYDYTHRLVVRAALTGVEPPGGAAAAQQQPPAAGG